MGVPSESAVRRTRRDCPQFQENTEILFLCGLLALGAQIDTRLFPSTIRGTLKFIR